MMVMAVLFAPTFWEIIYINSSLKMKISHKILFRHLEMDSGRLSDYSWNLQKVKKKKQEKSIDLEVVQLSY